MGELFFEQGFGESWLGLVRILNRVWGEFAFSCLIGAVRMGCRQNFGFLGRRGAWGWQFRATPHAEPYCPRDQTSGPLVRGSGSAFRI